jgi:hypothetical protein
MAAHVGTAAAPQNTRRHKRDEEPHDAADNVGSAADARNATRHRRDEEPHDAADTDVWRDGWEQPGLVCADAGRIPGAAGDGTRGAAWRVCGPGPAAVRRLPDTAPARRVPGSTGERAVSRGSRSR